MTSLPLTPGLPVARTRVIVIDDDPQFRNLISSVLRKDYFVFVASEGSEGYYKAIEHPPDVAVIDVQMPGWDGVKTLKAFRAHAQLAQTLIVMLTGDASRETVMAAIQAGANDYVIKTKFSREEFLSKLTRLLNGRDQTAAAASPTITSPPLDAVSHRAMPAAVRSHPRSELALVETSAATDLQAVMDAWE
jgi:DNA-binding response OmpR family regulator